MNISLITNPKRQRGLPDTRCTQQARFNPRWRFGLVWQTLAAFLAVGIVAGCGDPDVLRRPRGTTNAPDQGDRMFDHVAENLQRLPDFAPKDMQAEEKDILDQIVQRLNDWVTSEKPDLPTWQYDPLTSTLPIEMQRGGLLGVLEGNRFEQFDGLFLREAVWLRDASAWAVAAASKNGMRQFYDEDDERQKAAAIFDWTVRNIQLDSNAAAAKRLPLRPWEVLALGHGTEIERTWLFMVLARQQHLDVVILATADDLASARTKTPPPAGRVLPPVEVHLGRPYRFWIPALFHQGELYLFDMNLGLPVPGPDGKGIATLAQAAREPSVLKQLDVKGAPYPVVAADLKEMAALVDGDIPYLSKRMKLVENRLTGDRKVVLSVAFGQLAEALSKSPQIGAVRIWLGPYLWSQRGHEAPQDIQQPYLKELFVMSAKIPKRTPKIIQERRQEADKQGAGEGTQQGQDGPQLVVVERMIYPLWSGRQKQFQGHFDTPPSSASAPQTPANEAARDTAKSLLLDARLFAQVKRQEGDVREREFCTEMWSRANYWLGLVNYEQGDFGAASHFFEQTIKAGKEKPFYSGALYNLARAHQAAGKTDLALKEYEDPEISMPVGCQLRAKWLMDQSSAGKKSSPETLPASAPSQSPSRTK